MPGMYQVALTFRKFGVAIQRTNQFLVRRLIGPEYEHAVAVYVYRVE